MSKYAQEIERERDLEKEYYVKAAMLIKIHELVTWPEIPGLKRHSPRLKHKHVVTIGVVGKNPFPPKVQELFAAASNDHLQYKLLVSDTLAKRFCPILFIAEDQANNVETILRTLGSTPTLTISDIPGFAHRGGGIEFFLYGNRVIKMLINEQSALEKGLVYSREMNNPQMAKFIRKRH